MKTIRDAFDTGKCNGAFTAFGMDFSYDPGDGSLTFKEYDDICEAEFIFTPKGDKVHVAWSFLNEAEYSDSTEMDMDDSAYTMCTFIIDEINSILECEALMGEP